MEIKEETKEGVNSHIIAIGEQSAQMFKDGIDNYTIIFPDNNFSVEVIKSIDEDHTKEVCKLFNQIQNLIVFKNGEFYEC